MPLIKGKQIGTGADGIATANLVNNAVTPAKADLTSVWAFTAEPTYNADPVGNNGLTRKSYVDTAVAAAVTGLDVKDSCRVATTAALPTVTASGTGVGKTLTATAVGILTIDGVNTVLGDRILVQDQAAADDNGIYEVTTEGTAGVAFVLTRATDADQDAEVTQGMFTFIVSGTTNGGFGFYLTTADPITVDTTNLTFTQFSSSGSVSFGSPVAVGSANADGVATSAARSDHVHDSPVASTSNKNMTASVTTTDNDQATATTVASSNALGGYIGVRVNGMHVLVGNGTKVSVEAYFSGDSGSTARAFSAVVAGDTLHWNGSIAGYQLAASDRIDLEYNAF